MQRLPVIIAQGGISPAGRTSGFHGYRRLVFDSLSDYYKNQTIKSIASLTNASNKTEEQLLSETLIRKITPDFFDSRNIDTYTAINLNTGSAINYKGQSRAIPSKNWNIASNSDSSTEITAIKNQKIMIPNQYSLDVHGAGLLPNGFTPEKYYPARNHPRALAMTVYAVSDAIKSSGFSVDELKQLVPANEIGVYAGSAMGSMDYFGFGGMLQARLKAKRVTAKQCPLGFAEMPADFISAYILNSLGKNKCNLGACASLLYNLESAITDIQSGKIRIAIVGSSEAPVTPEIIEGYSAMKALATEDNLRKLDNLTDDEPVNWNKSCRPFGNNVGFTIAESAQYFILMDDKLALESGADILASAAGVFINADGNKKSISSPGAGNYITVAKSAALLQAIAGDKTLKHESFVQLHGTGTPQNRVTESHIFSTVAQAFAIDNWQATAVKNYLGHSIGTAAGDQLMSTLGVWRDGIIPGITNTKELATDVTIKNLNILLKHQHIDKDTIKAALINAKGFGGNNATAVVLSPDYTKKMLQKIHGSKNMSLWEKKRQKTQDKQEQHKKDCLNNNFKPIYDFGNKVIDATDIKLTSKKLTVFKHNLEININVENPYKQPD